MELNWEGFNYVGTCLEGLLFGMISVNSYAQVAKAIQHCAIQGLYSGIFAICLQLKHSGLQKSTDRARNILFYALSVLYALTTATFIVDMLQFCWIEVGIDDHCCLTLFQLVLQKVEIQYHLQIIQSIIFAFCDVMAQSILVRTTGNAYHY